MRPFYIKSLLFISACLLYSTTILAQGATCVTALAITPGTYTTDGASAGNGYDGICFGPGSTHADWYSYTPTSSVSISIIADSLVNLYSVSIMDGSCGATNCIETGDKVPINNVTVTAGITYLIQFDDFYNVNPVTWQLVVNGAAPPNDDCAGALPLTVYPADGGAGNEVSVPTNFASAGVTEVPSCLFGSLPDFKDLFYTFTVPVGNTSVALNFTENSNGLIQATVWDMCGGTGGGATELFCSDAITNYAVISGLVGGQTYVLQLGHLTAEIEPVSVFLEIPEDCGAGDINSTLVGTTISYCPGDTISFSTDGSEVIPTGETYVWAFFNIVDSIGTLFLNDANYTGDINADLGPDALSPGTYSVVGAVTLANQTDFCGGIATPSLTSGTLNLEIFAATDAACLNTSINNFETFESISLFPNPTEGSVVLVLQTTNKTNAQVAVVDMMGKVVFTESLTEVDGHVVKEFDLSALTTGVYFFEITSGDKKSIQKLVIN